jgi:hypothetical protein
MCHKLCVFLTVYNSRMWSTPFGSSTAPKLGADFLPPAVRAVSCRKAYRCVPVTCSACAIAPVLVARWQRGSNSAWYFGLRVPRQTTCVIGYNINCDRDYVLQRIIAQH